MRPVLCRMRTQPSRRRTVTVLATDAVVKLKRLRLLLRWHVKRVTDQTLGGLSRWSDIQDSPDTLRDIILQHTESSSMLVLRDPDCVFILENARGRLRLHAAVATAGRTSARAVVLTGSDVFLRVKVGLVRVLRIANGEQREKQPDDRQQWLSHFAIHSSTKAPEVFCRGAWLYDESAKKSMQSSEAVLAFDRAMQPCLDMEFILLYALAILSTI